MSDIRPDIGPRDVLDFWLKDTPSEKWFANDPALDAQIRARFEDVWRLGCAGGLKDWEHEPNGALALIILFDQFPRNMFRGTAEAFASDPHAREIAKRAIAQKRDLEVPAAFRSFFYLPLEHSENISDQEACVQLTRERLGEQDVAHRYALMHKDAIERFGRFPARNKALGRASTAEEQEFLNHNPRGF
jgi:uncharacterized protein (DUF924 family)